MNMTLHIIAYYLFVGNVMWPKYVMQRHANLYLGERICE